MFDEVTLVKVYKGVDLKFVVWGDKMEVIGVLMVVSVLLLVIGGVLLFVWIGWVV